MANNVVAFIGTDSFDIILYLSCILHHLDRKVLIADYSDHRALACFIPQIQGIDPETDVITYRHLDFTAQMMDGSLISQYDDIFIDCGCGGIRFDPDLLTEMVYVTDLYGFHMIRFAGLEDYSNLGIRQKLLIREVITMKFTSEYVTGRMNKKIEPDMISVLYRDDLDYENGLLCQNNQSFGFSRISRMLRNYLIREAASLYPQLSRKQIRAAYLKARRG